MLVEMQLSGKDGAHQFRPILLGLRAQLAPLLDPLAALFTLLRYGAHFEVNVTFIVHRYFENHHIGALDHRIDHLTVDEIDVGHAKEESSVLAVGIFDIALDPPFALLDGDDRVAEHDVVVHRVPMPLMHEAHVNAIERVVDVVEVIADAPQPATSSEISSFSKRG